MVSVAIEKRSFQRSESGQRGCLRTKYSHNASRAASKEILHPPIALTQRNKLSWAPMLRRESIPLLSLKLRPIDLEHIQCETLFNTLDIYNLAGNGVASFIVYFKRSLQVSTDRGIHTRDLCACRLSCMSQWFCPEATVNY